MQLEDHPTVKRRKADGESRSTPQLSAAELRQLALKCGADDVGLVELGRAGVDPQRDEILRNYPWTKTLLSFVVRMAREPVRGAPRSVANLEFHRAGHEIDTIGAAVVARLEARNTPPGSSPTSRSRSRPGSAIWASIAI